MTCALPSMQKWGHAPCVLLQWVVVCTLQLTLLRVVSTEF